MRFENRAVLAALLVAVAGSFAAAENTPTGRVFTICVPEVYWEECAEMIKDSAVKGIPISCISGRDRFECIERVGKKEADVVAVDPEDMYLAAKDNELAAKAGYSIVEQVRTKEEPDAPYRYEAVAVVHKDLNINNVQGLRGLKSCHTGIGRNVGYKIPITKLTAMGVLHNLHDPEYSARENELRALSSLFSKGCLVGTWSPDPAIHRRLKQTYSNMCALCEKPDVCDYPDLYSGYEGALRCLAHNGGEVAWTKVIYVKRFFGLPVGVSRAVPTTENPADFRYFCPDGSKVPIDANTKPCTWAARPWQGYMTNGAVQDVQAVQKELTDLGKLGEQEKADWWKDIMLLDEKTLAVAAPPIQPEQHLTNSKYLDVIERNSGAVGKSARWCVWDQGSLEKCRALARASFSRDVRPKLECMLQKTQDECLKSIKDGNADLTAIEGGSVARAIKDFNASPIIAESYGKGSTEFSERPAVAVVRKSASISKLDDLRGKKSCHSGYKGDFAGWAAPVHALKDKGLIASEEEVANFFSGSCAPGAPVDSTLCQQCVGSMAANDERVRSATKCKPNEAELFRGGEGALKCLLNGKGDVAFLPLPALLAQEENKTLTEDLKLLCPDGGLAPINEWQRCNLGMDPPRVIVTSAAKTVNAREELTHGTLAASTLYSKRPDLLHLFGTWAGQPNLLFRDDAKGLMSVNQSWNKWNDWQETERNYGTA
ncbi:transferrin [Osmia bicornis bicornis]|uniref:transferrin n=1 Tax=Osmia bicornis bicornis TaxID=1437191 RepID=UPI001EAECE7B|nr:transferrin [Osmia bicornis bicornis]